MDRQPVDSSVILAVGYDDASRLLEIVFHTGRIYRYFSVPPSEAHALLRADSIGGYFNREIRPRYHSVEVT